MIKKWLTISACLTLMACKTAQTPQQTLQSQLEQQLPMRLNQMGLMLMFVHNHMNSQTSQPDYHEINTTAPEYAICMQKALDNQFYQTELSQAVKNYLSEANQEDKTKDQAILNHQDWIKTNLLFKNIFQLYASQHSTEYKKQQYQNIVAQTKSLELGLKNNFSPTYQKYFNDNSELAIFYGKQIQQCFAYQLKKA